MADHGLGTLLNLHEIIAFKFNISSSVVNYYYYYIRLVRANKLGISNLIKNRDVNIVKVQRHGV